VKKLITVILILSLLLPAAALAVDGNSPFYGKWIGQKHGSTSNYSTILYYMELTKYTTSQYFVFYLHNGGPITSGSIGDQDIFSGNWEIINDHLSVPTSGISSIEVFYDKKTDTLYTKEWPVITFVRIP